MKAVIISLILCIAATGVLAQTSATWRVMDSWGQLPAGAAWGSPSQVAMTAQGQILVLRRTLPSFFLFNPDGTFVKSWGDTPYKLAHGVRVDREGFIWVTDNSDNLIQKFSADGATLLLTIGRKGIVGDNKSEDAFDGPADAFVAPNGTVYIADGYRNSRIVQFSKEGKFIQIIGGVKGAEPGQFNLPHALVVDSKNRIIVADAENNRVQVFDAAGKFLEQWASFVAKPRGAMVITADDTIYISHVDAEAISVVKDGKIVDVIRNVGGRPHGMTLDRDGNIYVSFPGTSAVKKLVKGS